TYDRNGRIVRDIEDDLATTNIQYDGVGRRVSVADPQGNLEAYTYDANNNVIQAVETDLSQKSGVSNETFTAHYQYDSRNRPTIAADNCANTRRVAYDSRNNVTDTTDAKDDATLGCVTSPNGQGNST